MPARSDKELIEAYRQSVGKDPQTRYPDDPDWLYRGGKDEREVLLERVEMLGEQEPLFKAA